MRVNDGLGLAANQAGLDLSLIVVEAQGQIFKLVNPRILKKEGSICFSEGCLSFPALELEVKRWNRVWVGAQNEEGKDLEIEVEGLLAVVLQHEIDHIQGKVFIDRISLFQKFKAIPGLRKITKETENELRKQKK
jgi:peptide deformylase